MWIIKILDIQKIFFIKSNQLKGFLIKVYDQKKFKYSLFTSAWLTNTYSKQGQKVVHKKVS